MAGYGAVWTPPPSRSDTSDFSVGYDVYDRFDLGYPGKPTLYGTETGLTTMIDTLHAAGLDSHVDFILNHNGYSTLATEGFYEAGGYPGLAITLPDEIDGDFHSAFWGGDEYERLAGLIDIAHERNHQFIRSPVDPADSRNIRAGTTPAFGRLANAPDLNNRQFYPDQGHNTIHVYDPKTGETDIPVHQFNLDDPMAGDATMENATGYLMRNAQWLIQVIGVDGLRIDAAKHVQGFTLDYLDRAVYRQNPRSLLDGSTKQVFSYSEVYDADPAVLHPHVKKDINPNDPGRIGGNRDTLDFKLYFALKENLEHGTQPGWDNWESTRGAWYQIKDAALDTSPAGGQGDTLHNGNAGVTFVQSHDVYKPYQLENVAYAYTLMMPGNTVVYFNGKEFGDNREFPKDGRSDALSVGGGSDLTSILNARNTHGRGNYAERWVDAEGLFAFERESSALTLLSNRTDGGFDSRTLEHVGFAPGTYLVELTGNAADPTRDPFNDIPEVVQVFDDNGVSKVNVRFPRNANANGEWTGAGYLVYGLPTPEAPAGLELIGVDSILAGNTTANSDFQNGTQRQTDLHVVTADQLNVRLKTVEVNLLGSMRDAWADGDNALLKLDQGRPINNLNPNNTSSGVDYDQPDSVIYGFEQFEQKSSPLIGPGGLGDTEWTGDGEFLQTIDVTQLEEGNHFLEARAFRHRTDNGPGVFSSFKKVIYVDRLPPDSTVASFEPWDDAIHENRDLVIRSLDKTANNVHVFLNLPAGTTDGQIMDMVNDDQGKAAVHDRDLFKYGYSNVPHGNNVATIVTFEATGNSNIQRVPGLFTSTIVGAGLGDLDHDGDYDAHDVQRFSEIYQSDQGQFDAAGDFTADGLTTYADLVALGTKLQDSNVSQATLDAFTAFHRDMFAAVDDSYTTNEDSQLTVQATGILTNDRNPGMEGSLNLETNGEVDTSLGGKAQFQSDGKFTYTPPASMQSLAPTEFLLDTVPYTIHDGLGNTDTGNVIIQVDGINDPPTLVAPGTFTINEDTDTAIPGITILDIDAGETPFRVTLDATHSTVTLGSLEGLTLSSGDGVADTHIVLEGTLTDVKTAVENLSVRGPQDYTGPASLAIEVDDRSNPGSEDPSTDSRTIVLTIQAVNDPPTLDAIDNLSIAEDAEPQTVNLTGIRPGPDENEAVRVTASSNKTNLVPDPTVNYTNGQATGTLTFTPVAEQNGTATITVTVEDAGDDGDLDETDDNRFLTRTFDVIVTAVNDLPIAGDRTYRPLDNVRFDNDLTTLVTDVDQDTLTFTVVTNSAHGELVVNTNGSYSYTPDHNFNLTDFFTYRANDGTGDSNIGTVTLQVDTDYSWYNCQDPRDVNDDNSVTPLDVLWIINSINSKGSHPLAKTRPEGIAKPFLDVNRDAYATPLDALWVINYLNQQPGGEGEGSEEATVATGMMDWPGIHKARITPIDQVSSRISQPAIHPYLDNTPYYQRVDQALDSLTRPTRRSQSSDADQDELFEDSQWLEDLSEDLIGQTGSRH